MRLILSNRSTASRLLRLSILLNFLLFIAITYLILRERSINESVPKDDLGSLIELDASLRCNQTIQRSLGGGRCDGKDGILLIQRGDRQSAVGTMFFLYAVNQLIYADKNNLQPWIHFLPKPPCYDPGVHGTSTTTFQMMTGPTEEQIYGTGDQFCRFAQQNSYYPGPLKFPKQFQLQNFSLKGNGVFETYFHSFGYPLDDISCRDKPLVILKPPSVDPGMHFCAPWAAQAWPHRTIPLAYRPEGQNITVHEWLQTKRLLAATQVQRYFKPLPWLMYHVRMTNPSSQCLSMHIRMTDKGNGRTKQPLIRFQEYAEAYTKVSKGNPIYVATDDATVIRTIQATWKISSLRYQKAAIRMEGGSSAIFHQFLNETHRTNTEGLVDIYAMSNCHFFVHGYSAMAEATIYVNPKLHYRSVNVDVPVKEKKSVEEFQQMVTKFYRLK
jgi:hypothetical protein